MSGQRFVAALFLLILAASTSPAAITITGSTLASAQTTPGIANSNTYTLTAISSAGKVIG